MAAYRDYECPACHYRVEDILGDYRQQHPCPRCWPDELIYMEWVPTVRCFAVGTFKTPLTLPVYGGMQVSSLREIRQLERDSEHRAANGEGEKLTVRAFSQDPGNMDVSTHGRPDQRRPVTRDTKGRPKIQVTKSTAQPEVQLGEGDTGKSALGEGF